MSKSLTVVEAKKRMEHYCAYQERCHKEVTQKLRSIGVSWMIIPEIISHLIQENYLNETRFAHHFARGKFRIKKWGKLRIVRELKQRDISEWNIQNALKEIPDEDYQKTFLAVITKFWEANKKLPIAQRKAKVIAALKYRGWELDKLSGVFERFSEK